MLDNGQKIRFSGVSSWLFNKMLNVLYIYNTASLFKQVNISISELYNNVNINRDNNVIMFQEIFYYVF